MKDLNIYFIRHSFRPRNIENECLNRVLEMLKKKERIAIHFTQETFHKWEKYSSKYTKRDRFKKAWDCLHKLMKTGGIVVAQYNPHEYLIGKVKKGSRLKFISPPYAPQMKGLKTLKLQATRKVADEEYPLLSTIKPRQCTINRIRKNAQYVLCAYGKIPLRASLDNLHYKNQETMCAEWLRSKHCPKNIRLAYLIASVGKTMEAVDILGVTLRGERLYGQVTYAKGRRVKKKLAALLAFSRRRGVNIMFSNDDDTSSSGDVKRILLKDVWQDLYHDKHYRKMLCEMTCPKK